MTFARAFRTRRLASSICAAAIMIATGCATTPSGRAPRAGACALPRAERVPDRRTPAQRIEQARAAHIGFRSAVDQPLPEADTMVLILLQRSLRQTLGYSIAAVRSEVGTWKISRVGRQFPNPGDSGEAKVQLFDTVLEDTASRALDAMLANPCLYRETPRPAASFTGSRAEQWTASVAIVTPGGTHIAETLGPVPGLTGEVVTAVSGW